MLIRPAEMADLALLNALFAQYLSFYNCRKARRKLPRFSSSACSSATR